jgi:hypothetical protein
MKINLLIAMLIFLSLLIFSSGCIEDNSLMVSGTLGQKMISGNTTSVVINEYTIKSKFYNTSSGNLEFVDGARNSEDTLLYLIEGTATNTGEERLAMVNISVRFYREMSKGQYYVGEKYFQKYSIDSGDSWQFSISYTDEDNHFGPIDDLDFFIAAYTNYIQ